MYGVTIYEYTYGPGQSNNLAWPDADAKSVAAMLSAQGYTVVLRYTDSTGKEVLVDPAGTVVSSVMLGTDTTGASGPSKANIKADIQTYFQGVGPNDVFLFYFSGHGYQDTTVSPPVEYFVPEGGIAYNAGSYSWDQSKWVSDTEFAGTLNLVNTRRKVVILDTCNSGGFIGNTLEADATLPLSLGSGGISVQTLAQAISNYANFASSSSTGLSPYGDAMVLSAAGRDEVCYETPEVYPTISGPLLNHGVMTYYLLQAQQSGDLNHDGHVTVSEAFSLAKAGIEANWNTLYPASAFEPHISGGPVDFVLW